LKETYVSGEECVTPAEVKRVLVHHPLVTACAVVGAPDKVWRERGLAFVAASSPISADELRDFAAARQPSYKLPRYIEFVAELPRSTIEKVARARLRRCARQLLSEQEENHDRAH